ncbi:MULTISPECIES: deoxyribodipyrimidine photo-lyase [unclassified Variovorax]|uniref:cryptochrome/photolyase family protein n=1 Tax=unclassified Variovorax TaxID=663243 RepID=UPI002577E074|nr:MULTISPECIES: deoxyribodipyrimidine photo-lyase [unclassified Variovorax]MDM0089555.1 deoxyribodipyrimidine photo-lyase [Variovorax sp. J22G40]MDM0147627.1 deoxyribodipyrimidine photo-lyase [Variovorax sp. J2P1-31]
MPPILLAVDKIYPKGLVWFRRDLRVDDNAALWQALRTCREVLCVFVLDQPLLEPLPRSDRRVEFIRESLAALDAELRTLGGGLMVRHAVAEEEIPELAHSLDVQAVFANRDYEPAAMARDARVFGALANAGITFVTAKDQAVFERDELLTKTGQPYTVFTPYKRAWLAKVDSFYLKAYPVRGHADALIPPPARHDAPVPTLADIGFEATNLSSLEIPTGAQGGAALFEDFFDRIDRYDEARNYPAVRGPSYLGVHLRFGTVSIRGLAGVAHQLALQGNAGAATWLSELIWRDFYFQVLVHHPQVAEGKSFRPEYDRIIWHHGKHADGLFAAWCEGRTGYPLIDAAMAQINQSGYMHNRLRMVVASFLCKDLGLDWRRGEAYFAQHLNDFELSSNNGGWQWASSSGCDAQPYFRIFNPVTQSERFDPEGKFIRRYLPQLAGLSNKVIHAPWTASPVELAAAGLTLGEHYPQPVVDHAEARERTLQRYGVVRGPKAKAAA